MSEPSGGGRTAGAWLCTFCTLRGDRWRYWSTVGRGDPARQFLAHRQAEMRRTGMPGEEWARTVLIGAWPVDEELVPDLEEVVDQ